MTPRIVLPDGGWGALASSRPPVLPPVWEALGLGAPDRAPSVEDDGGRHGHGAGEELVDPLVDAALGEIDAVLRSSGSARDAAFRLLAADALLTWACEGASVAEDPGMRLEQVVERMAAGAS